jgi:hypothetical protein
MENMNTFKRKALFTAVVAGLGVAGNAEAVFLSPNNTGQVLVYPYYTVQSSGGNSWNTYISVVNTTTFAKAVKVRILEGKTSAEVLDFNLFLSPNDVWTAAIIPGDATAASAGRIVTADTSCTRPVGQLRAAGEPFRNFQYSVAGSGDALPGTDLARTREGYVEMLEMGRLTGATATAVTHNSAGVPNNCGVVTASGFTTVPPADLLAPGGGLMGTGTLINVNSGRDVGYKADALDAWRNASRYTDSGDLLPALDEALPPSSLVIRSGDIDGVTGASTMITAYRMDYALTSGVSAGARAVASVFMHASVLNEYVLDNASASLTDWVLTQPIKNRFVTATGAAQPYTNVLTASGACELIGFSYFNREEQGAVAAGSDFSPIPPGAPGSSLCWESTVLSIRNPGAGHMPAATDASTVLGSRNVTNVNVTSGFQNGWASLTFGGAGALAGLSGAQATSQRVALGTAAAPAPGTVTAGAVTFFGLPVTGFMVRTFSNNTLTCGTASCQGNYGASFRHSYITTAAP